MDDIERQLHAAAVAARAKAYAPYSRFRVGAALLGADGRIHAGANVENAAYPQGQCAEASAIGVMVAAGCTEIARVMIVAEAGEGRPVGPCGGCRQRLREFGTAALRIQLASDTALTADVTLGDLLPMSFGPEHLR
jgi:cytidine deaminase